MKSFSFKLAPLALLIACGHTQEPEPQMPPAAEAEPAPAPVASAPPAPAAVAPTPPPDPAAEAAAKAAAELQAEFAAMEVEAQQESARFTPELRAKVKPLAEAKYGSAAAALKAILPGEHRTPGHAARDSQRHPKETLAFLGIKPTSTVLEYGPGEGWWTEILAPMLATSGKLIVTNGDPNGPRDVRSTLYAKRLQLFLDKAPELYGKVETARVLDSKNPDLGLDGVVDVALVFRGAHGWHNNGTTAAWLAQIHKALKPNGVLGIEQHRAKPDAEVTAASKNGYLPEKLVIEQIEAAGFKLAGKSEINANPKDTADHPHGVWSLPPTLRGGDVDREKYTAIGESDRMTLKFKKVKVKAPAAPKDAAAKEAAPAEGAPKAAAKKPAPEAAAPAAAPATPAAAAPAATP
jgi:predicted methyltransferase